MKSFLRTLIHTIPTRPEEELQFAINQYEDRYYIDVRFWSRVPNAKGLRPSRKGISLPLYRLKGLREGLDVLIEAVGKLPEITDKTDSFKRKEKSFQKPCAKV